MSTREEPWPQGTPSWTDLGTTDQAAAIEFYRALFGWEVEVGGEEYGNYAMCTIGGRSVAGIGQAIDTTPGWTTYLAVEDAEKAAESIAANGGTVVLPPMPVGDQGRMAIAQDPTGAFFGVWEAGGHIGAQVVNEPNAVVWNECMTREPDRARQFYAAVFGYDYRPLEGPDDYTVISGDGPGDTIGGIGELMADLPEEVPAHWMTYFMVTSADETSAKAAQQGGTVQAGPFDTPFGRMAVIRDPQGAVFSILQDTSGQQA